jgi:hypothetical protein
MYVWNVKAVEEQSLDEENDFSHTWIEATDPFLLRNPNKGSELKTRRTRLDLCTLYRISLLAVEPKSCMISQ